MNAVVTKQDKPLAVAPDTDAYLSLIERAARDPQVDVDKMERLMQMQERVLARNAEQQFNDAMMQAQAQIGRIAADRENKQTHSWYTTYAALDRVVRPVYVEHGFSLSFDTEADASPDILRVVCYVSHRGGHTRRYVVPMPADGKGAKGGDVMTKTHAAGSAMSYGQRYLLKLIFNVAIGIDPDDDDGNAAAVETISEKQAATIRDWIADTQSDEAKFCKAFKIESVERLPMQDYGRAIAAFEAKAKKSNV